MPAKNHIWNFEIAERLRREGPTSEAHRRRLRNLARIYDIEPDIISGSVRAIAESRELIAKANRLLSR